RAVGHVYSVEEAREPGQAEVDGQYALHTPRAVAHRDRRRDASDAFGKEIRADPDDVVGGARRPLVPGPGARIVRPLERRALHVALKRTGAKLARHAAGAAGIGDVEDDL